MRREEICRGSTYSYAFTDTERDVSAVCVYRQREVYFSFSYTVFATTSRPDFGGFSFSL